jgi:hypothetical protein
LFQALDHRKCMIMRRLIPRRWWLVPALLILLFMLMMGISPSINSPITPTTPLAASFSVHPRRCGNGDVFADREDIQKVEQYFAGATTVVNHSVRTFLLQPRLSVCSAHPDHVSLFPDLNKGRNPDNHAPSLDLLVLVPCPPQAADRRAAIRHTWGSVVRRAWPHSSRQWRVELFFLLGRPSAEFSMTVLHDEGHAHGDLLMADMLDSYRNLSLKMLAGLHWLTSHCDMQRVSHVLKADADTFVNVDLLLRVLEHLAMTQPEVARHAILGNVMDKCKVSVVHQAAHRHGEDPALFPFWSYPPYASGPAYLLPGPHVPALTDASLFFPLLSVEDAYFTGVVARAVRLPRVHLRGIMGGFYVLNQLCRPAPCLLLGHHSMSQLAGTDVSMKMMGEIWRAVQAGPEYCEHRTTLWNHACKGMHYLAHTIWPDN